MTFIALSKNRFTSSEPRKEQFDLPEATLFSIVSQRLRHQCAQNGKRVNIESVAADLYQEYKIRAEKSRKETKRRIPVIPQIARDRGFYPWMTFRACLQEWLKEKGEKVSKKMMSSFTRSPHLIRNVQLQLEAVHCALADELQGLITDQIRSLVGRDHELVLGMGGLFFLH